MNALRPPLQIALSSLLVALACTAHAAPDDDFLKEAAQSGMAEVKASQLIGSKTRNKEIESFAKTMVNDHTKAAQELKSLAATKKVELPQEPTLKQQTELKRLSSADPVDADKMYVKNFGVEAHEDTVKLFEKAAKKAEDPDVKAWAQKTLPTLQHHLAAAKNLPQTEKK